jgi:tetratricopeptide (TPR) repeat protein
VARPAGSDEAQLFWIATESATKDLAPGRYHVSFEPVEGLRIESGDLIVEETNPEHASWLGLLNIQRSLLLGKDDEALAEADRLTVSDPGNADAWIAKGDILMGKDLPDEALKAYDKALELQEKEDSEPLFLEERRRAAFFRSLEKRGVLSNTSNTQP